MADIFPGAKLMPINQWGYPQGQYRPIPSSALAYSVIHITANPTASAEGEAVYRQNNPWRWDAAKQQWVGVPVGATFFVNQDGSIVQCYSDPYRQDPWTNGALNLPDLTNPRIAAVKAAGVNPNERSLITIELCGAEPTKPITVAQEQAAGRLIAYYHNKAGLPISRETVVGHYQFDSVNRPNCPSANKAVIDRIVALARGGTVGTMPPGSKNAGPSIGTFAWAGFGHQLISPSDTSLRFSQALNPGPFSVIASLNLKDPVSGVPVDIDGRKPPQGYRDQVYLVEAPPFAAAAYVLRADGNFTAAPKDCSAEVADLQTQLDEANALLVQTQTELDDAEARLAAPNGTITDGRVVLT